MKFHKIKSEDNNSTYFVFKIGDIEYVNPIIHYTDCVLQHRTEIVKAMTKNEYRKYGVPEDVAEKVISKRIADEWKEEFEDYMDKKISNNFFLLLESSSKREQKKLLKDQSITSSGMFTFICHAYLDYHYTFSEYKSENYSKGVNKKSLPNFINIENYKVEKVGNTDLTDGQLKQVVEQRKVIIAKILDRDSNWHCFLLTYKSLSGNESWKAGKPHLHYISDKWGISRDELIKRIKSGKHPSTPLHIELINHRNPRTEE